MQNKKLAAIPLLVAIGLSIFGLTYAHWSDYLYIDGTVEMGTVAIGFTEFFCQEMYENPTPPPPRLPGEWLGKGVGEHECYLEDYYQDPHTLKEGMKTGVVKITNAYPCYWVHIVFTIENLGTLPVIFTAINIWDPTGTLAWDDALMALVDPATGKEIINFEIHNLIGLQLEYCEDTKAQVDVHFKQDAEECHTYEFKVEIVAIQWNKA